MKKLIPILLSVIFTLGLLGIQGCLSTQTPARGAVRGKILTSDGKPISGARVYSPGASTISNVFGEYSLDGLEPIIQTITVEKDGYESRSKQIEIREGQTGEGADFVLAEKGLLYAIQVEETNSTTAIVSFASRDPLIGGLKYGINAGYGSSTVEVASYSSAHRILLNGLIPATTYHFSCFGTDSKGRLFTSDDNTLTTKTTLRGGPPTNVTVEKESESDIIAISWSADTGLDLAGYRVYRANTPAGTFAPVEAGLITGNRYIDSGVSPGEQVYYRITRVSGTGEESPPSQTVSFLLPGVNRKNIVWTPDMSPIILTGNLEIRQDTSLSIVAGTNIMVAASDSWNTNSSSNQKIQIKISGSLVIEGSAANPVRITSLSSAPQPGDWVGITFSALSNLQISRINNLQLSFAQVGIGGEAGLPAIRDSKITQCSSSGVYSTNARLPVDLQGITVDSCNTGFQIASNTTQNVKIASCTATKCLYGIVSRDNKFSEVRENAVQFWTISGIDAGNSDPLSSVRNNVLGPSGNGSAIVTRGSDEIRRNTVQGATGIEIRGANAQAVLRSNLILADSAHGCVGVLYTGETAYSPASHTIQNNDVWNVKDSKSRYRDSSGNPLTGISNDLNLDPNLQGGTPFVEFPSASFNYRPSSGSPLKAQGYAGEDVGAFDVP
ncbi:MAG: carboxypeptidase regulatory-like domain-containing protein [Candidatus Riflebacteria bacterium]|nr:carboxypeptidase regulatory-like domain-containing protein [Candidatus Riflebacteria bacterium]